MLPTNTLFFIPKKRQSLTSSSGIIQWRTGRELQQLTSWEFTTEKLFLQNSFNNKIELQNFILTWVLNNHSGRRPRHTKVKFQICNSLQELLNKHSLAAAQSLLHRACKKINSAALALEEILPLTLLNQKLQRFPAHSQFQYHNYVP